MEHITGDEPCCLALQGSSGLDNLLYSADADFSCFADLAVTSPVDYYLEGQGSLMQCVLTPATQYMPMPNEDIAARVHQQVGSLWMCLPGHEICATLRCDHTQDIARKLMRI